MRTDYLQITNTATLDSNGNGLIAIRPDAGQYWQPSFIRVSTGSQTIPFPYCAVYISSTNSTLQSEFIDDTFRGNSDTSSIASGTVVQFGQSINAQFTGGTPGDTAILTIYGIFSDTPPSMSGYLPQVPGAHFTGRDIINVVDNPIGIETRNFVAPVSPTLVTHGLFKTSTFQSWTGYFNFSTLATTQPYINITFTWTSDAAGTIPLYTETWVFDTTTAFLQYLGHGPMYGPYMLIQYSNYDTAQTVTVKPNILGSNRIVTESTFRSIGGNTGAAVGTDDVLVWTTGTIAANSNSGSIKCNFYNGPVTLKFNVNATSIVANTCLLRVDFQPKMIDFNNNSALTIPGPAVAAGTLSPDQIFSINLPRRPVSVFVANTSTTITVNYAVWIIAKGAVT